MSEKYLFTNPLIEGLIKSRPNRFIMIVEINGKEERCHCPSTGRIASIKFSDIPCLVSKSDNPERKTPYTVEAFSLDPKQKETKSWIGINQTKANAYIEYFLSKGLLNNMTSEVKSIKREVPLGKSRIDFLINNNLYLEVKTPLKDIPSENHPNYKKYTGKFISFQRLIKHFKDISKDLTPNSKALFVMCYIYPAVPFKVPVPTEEENKIVKAARSAHNKGVETWQINLSIDKEGVSLLDYFKLNLFS